MYEHMHDDGMGPETVTEPEFTTVTYRACTLQFLRTEYLLSTYSSFHNSTSPWCLDVFAHHWWTSSPAWPPLVSTIVICSCCHTDNPAALTFSAAVRVMTGVACCTMLIEKVKYIIFTSGIGWTYERDPKKRKWMKISGGWTWKRGWRSRAHLSKNPRTCGEGRTKLMQVWGSFLRDFSQWLRTDDGPITRYWRKTSRCPDFWLTRSLQRSSWCDRTLYNQTLYTAS